MDTSSSKKPIKAWLILSLAVLFIHLALLMSVPVSVGHASDLPMSFIVRTVEPEASAEFVPQQTPPQEIVQDVAKPAAQQVAQPAPAPEPISESGAIAMSEPDQTTQMDSSATTNDTALPPPDLLAAVTKQPDSPENATPLRSTPKFSADGLPGSVKLNYKVSANKFPFSLNGELTWAHDGGTYQSRLSFGAFGQKRVQTSQGRISKSGLEPERFSDKFRGEVAAHFNRAQNKVTFSANTPDVALQTGAQDRLSILMQLAAMVATAPGQYAPATTLVFQTIGPREAEEWLFTVGEMEKLDLPGGPKQGLKLTRKPRQQYDQRVEIWLAPSLSYLPARIRITESNGDYIDQQWLSSESTSLP